MPNDNNFIIDAQNKPLAPLSRLFSFLRVVKATPMEEPHVVCEDYEAGGIHRFFEVIRYSFLWLRWVIDNEGTLFAYCLSVLRYFIALFIPFLALLVFLSLCVIPVLKNLLVAFVNIFYITTSFALSIFMLSFFLFIVLMMVFSIVYIVKTKKYHHALIIMYIVLGICCAILIIVFWGKGEEVIEWVKSFMPSFFKKE